MWILEFSNNYVTLLYGLHCILTLFRFKQELIPFSDSIFKLVQQTLEWTEKMATDPSIFNQDESFKSVRLFAYKTLNAWLTYTGSVTVIETFTNCFLPLIIKDIKGGLSTSDLTASVS